MTETLFGELLLYLALLFALTYALAGFLTKLKIPIILGALFVAMVAHYTPIGPQLLTPPLYEPFSFLAQFGVFFLLFYIGLQIDLKEMRGLGSDIVWCTVLNTAVPFLFGMAAMLGMGYGYLIAFVVGLTRMPTAEAVIVPILDEFQLIRTRVGSFIIGVGTLDDIIEVFVVVLVSVWVGTKASGASSLSVIESELVSIFVFSVIFVVLAIVSYRWVIPLMGRWLPKRPRNLIMLAMLVLMAFGGLAEYGGLGLVVGAIVAGILVRPVFNSMGLVGEQATHTIQSLCYGFFGLIFFFWVGLSLDLGSIAAAPFLAILLYLAGTIGKLIGVFLMVPMKKLSTREAWTIGIGLDARLTTEIIVVKMLLDAGLIDKTLFTALVGAASFTAISVPLLFTLLMRRWGDELRGTDNAQQG